MHRLDLVLVIILSLAVLSPGTSHSHEPSPAVAPTALQLFRTNISRGGVPEPGVLLVERAEGTALVDFASDARRLGCTVVRELGRSRLTVVRCDPSREMDALVLAWSQVTNATWVEANFDQEAPNATEANGERVPDDLVDDAWHHRNTGQKILGVAGKIGADIESAAAWAVTTGSPEVVVAVIDSGIYTGHEDLQGKMWKNSGETCPNEEDDDGNGYVDDCDGWDTGEGDNGPNPSTLPEVDDEGEPCSAGHATFIAGLISAAGDNGVGTAGVGWNLRIMNLKGHSDETCQGNVLSTIEAVLYAVDHGARVINMSFQSSFYSKAFEQVLRDAEDAGVLLVISAGNEGDNVDAPWVDKKYPRSYELAHKLVVANSNNLDEISESSNWGLETVQIAAPGTDLYSLSHINTDAYNVASGTSFAAPLVAGGAALLWSAYPELSLADVSGSLIEGSVTLAHYDCADNKPCVSEGKRLSVAGALDAASQRVALLQYDSHAIEDEATGNGNGLADREETIDVRVVFHRDGPRLPTGLVASISTSVDLITITGDRVQLSAADETAETLVTSTPFVLDIGDCNAAQTAPIAFDIHDDMGARWTGAFELELSCGEGPVAAASGADTTSDDDAEAQAATVLCGDGPCGGEPVDSEGGSEGCHSGGNGHLGWILLVLIALFWRRRGVPIVAFCVLFAACAGGEATDTDAEAASPFGEGSSLSGGTPEGGDDASTTTPGLIAGLGPSPDGTCRDGGSCPSGLCIVDKDGDVCTNACSEGCPDGWFCTLVPDSAGAAVEACAPPHITLCRPCFEELDCRTGAYDEAICHSYGPAGSFCASPCGESIDCPTGYACSPVTTNSGSETVCLLESGLCPCDAVAIAEGLSTTCSNEGLYGDCPGSRTCTVNGLSECEIASFEEVCNGLDDDCDGVIDNGLSDCNENTSPDSPDDDEDGYTLAMGDCDDANPSIHPGAPELCNNVNDDCDTEIDEGVGTESCEVENANGTCPGTSKCSGGTIKCQGEGPDECGGCTGLPPNYGNPCGCGGVVGCGGVCVSDLLDGCLPTACTTGVEGSLGSSNCASACPDCANMFWSPCTCSSNAGAPTMLVDPPAVVGGQVFRVYLWAEATQADVTLRVNGSYCPGVPSASVCSDIPDCGGHVWMWGPYSLGSLGLEPGENDLEVFRDDPGSPCWAADNPGGSLDLLLSGTVYIE